MGKEVLITIFVLIPMGIMFYGRLFFWMFSDDMKDIYKKAFRELWEEHNGKDR